MKVLVTYNSQSGKTKMIAEAIYSSLKEEADAVLNELGETKVTDLVDYDIVFIGSPCHSADIVKPVREFLEKIPNQSKFKLAGFITHSCYPPEKGGIYEEMFEKWAGKSRKSFEKIAAEKKLDFIGFFRCMGAATAPIENFIKTEVISDEKEFEEFLLESRKHPDEKDLSNAKAFAQKIIGELK